MFTILGQEHPPATYYELEHLCSVEDIYNMLEIIEGHLLIKEEAQKEAERKAAAKKGRG